MFNASVTRALTDLEGCSNVALVEALNLGLVTVSPATGYFEVSAKGAAHADAAAWGEEYVEEYTDLAAFDPSKF